MNKSDSIKQLAIALNKFQSEVSNPKKTETNPFHGSKYAPLSSVIDQVKPVLDKHGLCFSQLVSGDGAKSSVTTLLMHESGEWIESEPLTFPNQISKGDSAAQGGGSSITYARRYSLEAILGISSEEDNDGNTNDNQQGNNNYNSNGNNYNNKQNNTGNNKIDNPGEVSIKWGKYNGKKLKDLPENILHELHDEARSEFYKKAIKAEVANRNNNQRKREMTAREKQLEKIIVDNDGRKTVIEYLEQATKDLNKKIRSVDDLPQDKFDELLDYMASVKAQYDREHGNISSDESLLPDDFEVPF